MIDSSNKIELGQMKWQTKIETIYLNLPKYKAEQKLLN